MSDVVKLVNEHTNYAIYNTREKIYKNGLCKLKKTSFNVVKGKTCNNIKNGTSTLEELEKHEKRHLKEKKEKILDLALNNDNWEYFVTLTFDDKEFPNNIYSHEDALELLRKWIDNQKHQNKDMSYLMVAEFHKSGRLHFHGIFSNVPKWKLSLARNKKNNRKIIVNGTQIYNLDNYKLGFTTVSEVKYQDRVSSYISKYITKELMHLRFKKAFWYSRNLEKPKIDYHYFDSNLKDIYQNKNILFNSEVEKNDCTIELLNFNNLT